MAKELEEYIECFNVGDCVKCINNKGSLSECLLTIDKVYLIEKVISGEGETSYNKLCGIDFHFLPYRFQKVKGISDIRNSMQQWLITNLG